MSSQLSTAPRQTLNQRQADTVERLLRAAQQELDAVGAQDLTIRTVAARAGVSPATAYTYLASKDHLFAELFWRYLDAATSPRLTGRTPTKRLQQATRSLAAQIEAVPTLAAAVTKSLLVDEPEVDRLRLRIGGLFARRFADALGDQPDEDLMQTLLLAFSGALLQTGMGLLSYRQLADHLDRVVAVIMGGRR